MWIHFHMWFYFVPYIPLGNESDGELSDRSFWLERVLKVKYYIA